MISLCHNHKPCCYDTVICCPLLIHNLIWASVRLLRLDTGTQNYKRKPALWYMPCKLCKSYLCLGTDHKMHFVVITSFISVRKLH